MNALGDRAAAIAARIAEYRELASSSHIKERTQVYLGDGYFAEMSRQDAQQFMNRKISYLSEELDHVNGMRGVNEEGLPIMDIVEELDQDGNILTSRVERAGSSLSDIQSASAKSSKSTSHPVSKPAEVKKTVEAPKSQPADPLHSGSSEARTGNGNILEPKVPSVPFADAEVNTASPAVVQHPLSHPQIAGRVGMDGHIDILPEDILELRLDDDEDDVDYDFNNVSEESDDNSDDDRNEVEEGEKGESFDQGRVWRGGSLFPQDERTQRLLEQHFIGKPKAAEITSAVPISKPTTSDCVEKSSESDRDSEKSEPLAKRNSSVHFSNSVDVREFETTASERKGKVALTDAPRKTSQFMLQRKERPQRASIAVPAAKAAPMSGALAAATVATAASAASAAASAAVAASVVERSPNRTPPRFLPKVPNRTNPNVHGLHAPHNGQNHGLHSPHASHRLSTVGQSPAPAPTGRLKPALKSAVPAPEPSQLNPDKKGTPDKIKHDSRLNTASKASPATSDSPCSTQPIKTNPKGKTPVTVGTPTKSRAPQNDTGAPLEPIQKPTPVRSMRNGVSTEKPVRLIRPSDYVPPKDPAFAGIGDIRDEDVDNEDIRARVAAATDEIFESSFIPDEAFIELHDHESEHDTELAPGSVPDTSKTEPAEPLSDRPILEPTVVEREVVNEPDNATADNLVDMHEIKQEYQNLRQRLMYESGGYKKTAEEAAVEPVSDKPKTSRFKAARISH